VENLRNAICHGVICRPKAEATGSNPVGRATFPPLRNKTGRHPRGYVSLCAHSCPGRAPGGRFDRVTRTDSSLMLVEENPRLYGHVGAGRPTGEYDAELRSDDIECMYGSGSPKRKLSDNLSQRCAR
jgi:hypothetical protein